MTYSYQQEKAELLEDKNQALFIKGRDKVMSLLAKAGAIRMLEAMDCFQLGTTWQKMAAIDRMVELGDVVEIPRQCWAQFKVYARPETYT